MKDILFLRMEELLIIFVDALNSIKEVESHFFVQDFLKAGFNVFSFDGYYTFRGNGFTGITIITGQSAL